MLLTLLLSALPQAEAAPASAHSIPRDRVHYSVLPDATWMRGASYKARIDAAGLRYVPFLGSDAPRNFPVDMRLRGASVDGRPLELSGRATVTRDGDRFTLDRGPVRVVYDVRNDGIEQSFVIDLRARRGAVTLDLEVATDLVAGPRGHGLRYATDLGGVDYSAAIAIDADGRSVGAPIELRTDGILLDVPASFVAAAPGETLVVDPLVSTYGVDVLLGDQFRGDVTHLPSGFRDTFVHEDKFSTFDTDVYRITRNGLTNVLVTEGYVDVTDDDWIRPKVASHWPSNRDLVVAQKIAQSNSAYSIVGAIIDHSTELIGPRFTIMSGSPLQFFFGPDVGGYNRFQGPGTQFLVGWITSSPGGYVPQIRTVSTSGQLGAVRSFPGTLGSLGYDIAISKGTSPQIGQDLWNVAYLYDPAPGLGDQVNVVQVDTLGSVVGGPTTLYAGPPNVDLDGIDVSESIQSGGSHVYVASWRHFGAGVEGAKDFLLCYGTGAAVLRSLSELEHAPKDREIYDVKVGTIYSSPARPEFLFTYTESSGPNEAAVYATTVELPSSGAPAVNERRVRIGTMGRPDRDHLAIASRTSGGANSRFYAVTWTSDLGDANSFDIYGATLQATAPELAASQYCYGYPNSTGDRGFLRIVGDRSTTAPKTLSASALPANSFGYFLVGMGDGSVDPVNSSGKLCLTGSHIGRYSNSASSSGSAGVISLVIDPTTIPQPSGLVAALPGETWRFQLWHRDAGQSGPTSNFSNACALRFQ